METSHSASSLRPAPFDVLAESYDEVVTNALIGQAQRGLVWRELDRVFHPGQRILELNCGTGVDAVHLAGRGVEVLACDVAPRMIDVALRRAQQTKLQATVHFRVLATEEIGDLHAEGPFDGVFSDFAGLNCVENLSAVASSLAKLVRPGAIALLCLLGSFCAWETAWYLYHLDLRKAFRRRTGIATVQLAEAVTLPVYYFSARALARMFAPSWRLQRWKGVGVAVPPYYLEAQARRFPHVLKTLARLDRWLGRTPVLRGMADHILLTFQRV